MKNVFLLFLPILILQSCGNADKEVKKTVADNTLPKPSKNSDTFNQSFEQLLSSYYSLRDAFVDYDTAKMNKASGEVALHAGSIQMDQFKNDSSGAMKATALDYTGSIKNAAGELTREAGWEKKQRKFQAISDAMYELVRTVKYDKQKIYHQHCPMAFENEGAYWLSSSNEIVNPYFGKKHPKYRQAMLECGDIPDSLDFSR